MCEVIIEQYCILPYKYVFMDKNSQLSLSRSHIDMYVLLYRSHMKKRNLIHVATWEGFDSIDLQCLSRTLC